MSREWKPGDVAVLSFDASRAIGVRTAANDGWHHSGGFGGGSAYDHIGGYTARPLVVIDPDDRKQVRRLADLLGARGVDAGPASGSGGAIDWDAVRASHLREALRSLTPPLKPDEPTGWLAAVLDADGNRWCLHGGPTEPGLEWYSPDLNARRPWERIAAVKVLSDGVTS